MKINIPLMIAPIKKIIIFKKIDSNVVSPGLSVKIYLKKFIKIKIWIKNTVKNKGNWPLILFLRTYISEIENDKKIIPIISLSPAIAWLKIPKLFMANSSVYTSSWME